MSLTVDRNTSKMGESLQPERFNLPMKAAAKIFAGSLVCRDLGTTGAPVTKGAVALNLLALGRSERQVDNTSGAQGDKYAEVLAGVYRWANSSAADAIVETDIGKPCWIVDDQTVALTSAQGTRSPAGRVVAVETAGVWVMTSPSVSKQILDGSASVPIPFHVVLSKHSNGSIAARFTPGFAGRIAGLDAFVEDSATTGAKLATFTPAVATVATTGAAVALTSANCTPVGAKIAGSAITAGDTFGATDEITIAASAVTAFVEGSVALLLRLVRFP